MVVSLLRTCLRRVVIYSFLIQGCLSAQQTRQSPMFAMSDVTNDLGACALQLLATSMPGRNLAFSPYGLASVSMLLYEGASGNTADQLRTALQLPHDAVYARVGFRDLYRHLRTYFMSDGFLKGLMLSRDGTCIKSDYMKVLTFYGFDLPEHSMVEPCNGTTSSTPSVQTSTSSSAQSNTSTEQSSSSSSPPGMASGSFTTGSTLISTTSDAENKEKPTPGSTESTAETTPFSTTFNPLYATDNTFNPDMNPTTLSPYINPTTFNPDMNPTSLNPDTGPSITTENSVVTNQGSEPSVLEQITSSGDTEPMRTTSSSIETTTNFASMNVVAVKPTINSIDLQTIIETTINPMNMETTNSPMNMETIINPMNMETTNSPMNMETTINTMNVETTINPMNMETTNSPMNMETIINPMNMETTNSPMNMETTINTMNVETTIKPMNMETTINPMNMETTTNPMNMETTINSMDLEMSTELNPQLLLSTQPLDEVPTNPSVVFPTEESTVPSDKPTESTSLPSGEAVTEEVTTFVTNSGANVAEVTTVNNFDPTNMNADSASTEGYYVSATTIGNTGPATVTPNGDQAVMIISNPGNTSLETESMSPVEVSNENYTPTNVNGETTPLLSVTQSVVNGAEITTVTNEDVTTISMNEDNNADTGKPIVEASTVNSDVSTGQNDNEESAITTTLSSNNDTLSTILEVTELSPSTDKPQVLDGQDIGYVTTSTISSNQDNTSPGNDESTKMFPSSTTVQDSKPDDVTTTSDDIIIFNTTPPNKSDNLSTLVEVTLPPPSPVNVDDDFITERPLPQINTTGWIDTSPIQTTKITDVEVISSQIFQNKPSSQIQNKSNNESAVTPKDTVQNEPIVTQNGPSIIHNDPVITTSTFITESSQTNTNPTVELVQPAASVNSLVTTQNETHEILLDGHNPNDQAHIINNVVQEDILHESIPSNLDRGKPTHQDKLKPTKASIILNYDYLNPDNFQEYVNIVDKVDNHFNDADVDFTDALIQDDKRRNKSKSLVHHFMDNNQVRYTYETYFNDYEQHVDVRHKRSFDYEPPLLHKIKSWIKFKSGFSHMDPLSPPPAPPAFDPPLSGFIPSFAGKSGDFSGPTYSGDTYSASREGQSASYTGSHSYGSSGSSKYGTSSSYSGSYSPASYYQSYLPSSTYQTSVGSTYNSPGSSYGSKPGESSYYSGQRPSVTPSYEPPYTSYTNRESDHLDWFLANGRAKVVPVMRYSAVLPYAYISALDAFALEIPLDDEKYKLLVVLPSSSDGLPSLLKSLPYCSIRAIYSQLRYFPVYATLPVFNVMEQISLTPALQQMGVTDIFYLSKADLSTMSSDANLFVRDIMQVVAIYAKKYSSDQVHEIPTRSAQTTFTASHSFVYFVVDNFTKVSLLAGIVEDPSINH